jgi:hypothetical protein
MYGWLKARLAENSTQQALAFFIALGVMKFMGVADWGTATAIASSAVGVLKVIQSDV